MKGLDIMIGAKYNSSAVSSQQSAVSSQQSAVSSQQSAVSSQQSAVSSQQVKCAYFLKPIYQNT
jgi:hypothetical protein